MQKQSVNVQEIQDVCDNMCAVMSWEVDYFKEYSRHVIIQGNEIICSM